MPPQLSDKFNLNLNIDAIGEPIASDISIMCSKQNTFSKHEQVAIKSSDNSLHFGLVIEKVCTWFIWTDIYQVDDEKNKPHYRGRLFIPSDIAKLPTDCQVTQNDIGDTLHKKLALFIEWNDTATYKKGEIVAVRRTDCTLKYGCIEKMDITWLVACKDESNKVVNRLLRPENIGKFVDSD